MLRNALFRCKHETYTHWRRDIEGRDSWPRLRQDLGARRPERQQAQGRHPDPRRTSSRSRSSSTCWASRARWSCCRWTSPQRRLSAARGSTSESQHQPHNRSGRFSGTLENRFAAFRGRTRSPVTGSDLCLVPCPVPSSLPSPHTTPPPPVIRRFWPLDPQVLAPRSASGPSAHHCTGRTFASPRVQPR